VIQVYISESFYRDSLDIYIIRKTEGDPRYILRVSDDRWGQGWEQLPEGAALADEQDKPTFCIPFEVGHALLEALVRHYQGAEDTRQLRKDYEAERKRVDHHAEVIADIARSLAIRSTH
jgi:hypothetical protein